MDPYVGVLKGVILSIAPAALLVDVSHLIEPQKVEQGAVLLQIAYRHFPADSIHLAVVDPGVGTARTAIAVQAPSGFFVGPDNGVFSRALVDQDALDPRTGELRQGRAVALTNETYWRHPVSRTFHGRDIFGPVAAHLANGVALTDFGPSFHRLTMLPARMPEREGSVIRGSILHVDRFGNAISNVEAACVGPDALIAVGGRELHGLATNYQDGEVVAIAGSAGLIEIAEQNGSAAQRLGLQVGDPIVVRSDP